MFRAENIDQLDALCHQKINSLIFKKDLIVFYVLRLDPYTQFFSVQKENF